MADLSFSRRATLIAIGSLASAWVVQGKDQARPGRELFALIRRERTYRAKVIQTAKVTLQ
jgi:hypothetical protein